MEQGPVRVKVCGITSLEDAQRAVALGAWAVGMVFYERSPRRCSFEEALLIATALRRQTVLCGVFVNAGMDEVLQCVEDLHLDAVQLHGEEGPSYCAAVARRGGVRVIKGVRVGSAGDLERAARFHVDFHLLDARPRQEAVWGGSGETFDWDLLKGRRSRVPLILSGGLTPANVGAAVASAAPHGLYAVDTASGTEASPGRKDPALLEAFFAAVAQANGALLKAGVR